MAVARVPLLLGLLGSIGCTDASPEITLSQTTSSAIANGIGLACIDVYYFETSVYRAFVPADHGLEANDFHIRGVEFGLESAAAGDGTGRQAAQIIIHRYTGTVGAETLDPARMERLVTSDVYLDDTALPINVSFPVAATIPAGTAAFAVEVRVLTGATAQMFTIGMSNQGETRPGYARCPDDAGPRSIVSLGHPNHHLILSVSGYAALDLEPPTPLVPEE